MSRDHKPDQTDERQRIEEAGGFVMWAGIFLDLLVLFVGRIDDFFDFSNRLKKCCVQELGELEECLLYPVHLVIDC